MIEFLKNAERNKFTAFALWCVGAQMIYVIAALIVQFEPRQHGPSPKLLADSSLILSAIVIIVTCCASAYEKNRRWLFLPLVSIGVGLASQLFRIFGIYYLGLWG